METLIQHLTNQPTIFVIFIIAIIIVLFALPYFVNQNERYGSPFIFASQARKITAIVSLAVIIGALLYGSTPYVAPPTNQIALVLGGTQNTPNPKITTNISDAIVGTMLQHKGDNVNDLADSIKIISAYKNPEVVGLYASELKLKVIGRNNSNAKRTAQIDIKALQEKIDSLSPSENGANYLEAVLKARDNVKEGSRIIVIGSGLSDSGDLDFSKSNILTDENERKATIEKIIKQYGSAYLDNYSVEFYGLGDTVGPQENLSTKQKEIVREIYADTITGIGGKAKFDTKTLVGDAIKTNYLVGTTDTGCGNIGLLFDDESLKFVGNEATFIDKLAAKNSLMSIKNLWDKYSGTISTIQIDGYIAHYNGHDNLSQERAESVKRVLVDIGVPENKVNATGQGFGPYQVDAQNRMVKVTISRNNDQCDN